MVDEVQVKLTTLPFASKALKSEEELAEADDTAGVGALWGSSSSIICKDEDPGRDEIPTDSFRPNALLLLALLPSSLLFEGALPESPPSLNNADALLVAEARAAFFILLVTPMSAGSVQVLYHGKNNRS